MTTAPTARRNVRRTFSERPEQYPDSLALEPRLHFESCRLCVIIVFYNSLEDREFLHICLFSREFSSSRVQLRGY